MSKRHLSLLLATIALCESIGVIGSSFTAQSVLSWYPTLIKPSFTPPSWLFGPVWITLYAMMGVALYLVLRKRHELKVKPAVVVFSIQLLLNALWSPAFFGMRSPLFGFMVIVPMLAAVAITTVMFFRISKPAGWLFVPYFLWTAFATALNYQLLQLN